MILKIFSIKLIELVFKVKSVCISRQTKMNVHVD